MAYTFIDETGAGLEIGGAATVGKVAFWGATPVVQPTNAAQAAVTSSAPNTITDSSGGTDPGDDTIAEIEDIALSTSDTYTDSAVNGAVNAAVDDVSNAVKQLSTKLNLCSNVAADNKTLVNRLRTDLVALGLIKGS